MNDKQSSGWFEIGVYSVLLCVVASVFWSTLGLPASTREPPHDALLRHHVNFGEEFDQRLAAAARSRYSVAPN